MGAKIKLFSPPAAEPAKFYNFEYTSRAEKSPHAANIFGPTKLQGSNLEVTDIRSGATLVFAALMAKGRSEITGIEHIERGYDDLEGRLEQLGARIKKVG